VFREGLLTGRRIAVAGAPDDPITDELRGLGAELVAFPGGLDEAAAQAWAAEQASLSGLLCDVRGVFASDGLQPALQFTWSAVRAAAVGALIPGEAGGKIILLAPGAGAAPYAEAVRSGLENLARTLSVEWARYAITVTAIAPGAETNEGELAALLSFLISPAGDYYSGCRFELGAVSRP
jgi:NAD(P)-dependent dehydrogenase (short-subunit alcohol dehydrogenase family)